ncbi:MAG: SMI1/KNR4 family protein [Acidobacteriota bacterium]
MDPERVVRLLAMLREADERRAVFGAGAHEYRLDSPLSEAELVGFEERHGVPLPEDYRSFLLHCGNGGAGPYYGLFPLGLFDGAGRGLEPWKEGDGHAGVLRHPFPHSTAWNLPDESFVPSETFSSVDEEDAWHERFDAEYWAPELVAGSFPICHQGCAYRNFLIVTGASRGQVWVDGRASDGGLVPELNRDGTPRSFSSWYFGWLEDAFRELGLDMPSA